MREVMKMSVVLAIAMLVCAGCTKKAKVNLDGLDQNPAGSMQDGSFGTSGLNGPGTTLVSDTPLVPPVGDPSLFGVANSADGNGSGIGGANGNGAADANGGAGGGWTGLDNAVGGSDVENFIKNGQYFAQKVYFDFNRSEVRPSERPKLEALANHLQNNPTFGVIIEGHCDERGSDEYNRSLSERRSLAVKEYLAALGIANNRMRTISYGEDRPDIPNAQSEQQHKMNRRAQFLVGAHQ